MRAPVFGLSMFTFLALFASGCSSGDHWLPVHPTRGRVLFDGKPIPQAHVTLHPLNSSDPAAPRPRAIIADDGTFELTTYVANDGAPVGEYAVTIDWWRTDAKPGTQEGDSPPPTNRLPARYSRPATSNLRVRIEPGDNQIPVIQLSR